MKIFTKQQYNQLIKNGSPEKRGQDHKPVVKLSMPGTGCTWLLTEIDPEYPNIAFGFCDLGMGYPELGYVDIHELAEFETAWGATVENDMFFISGFPISVYARAARNCQQITEHEAILKRFTK